MSVMSTASSATQRQLGATGDGPNETDERSGARTLSDLRALRLRRGRQAALVASLGFIFLLPNSANGAGQNLFGLLPPRLAFGAALLATSVYLYWAFYHLVRKERESARETFVLNDRYWWFEFLQEEAGGGSAILAIIGLFGILFRDYIPTNPYLWDVLTVVGGVLTLLTLTVWLLLPKLYALRDMVGRSDEGALRLSLYEQAVPTLADHIKGFFLQQLTLGQYYAHKVGSGETPIAVTGADEDVVVSLITYMLTKLPCRAKLRAFLMPSASGRLSHVGVTIKARQGDLRKRGVVLKKCYVFFDRAQHTSDGLKGAWIGNIGPLVESAAALMFDEPLARSKSGEASAIRTADRADWLDPLPSDRKPGPLELNGETFNFSSPEVSLIELLWVELEQDNCCLIFVQRNHADKFERALIWPDARSIRSGVVRFLDNVDRNCSSAWHADAPHFLCAFSNAVAIRDSQPKASIWVTEVIPEKKPIQEWFAWWFPEAMNLLEHRDADDLELQEENVGRALVWRYSKESSDFKNLHMRRIFFVPQISAMSTNDRIVFAQHVIAAMTINALFNIEPRAIFGDPTDADQNQIADSMIKWDRGGAMQSPEAVASGTWIYYCGVSPAKTPVFEFTKSTAHVDAFARTWKGPATYTANKILDELIRGIRVPKRQDFIEAFKKGVEKLILVALVTPSEERRRWHGPERLRAALRGSSSAYEVSFLLTGEAGLDAYPDLARKMRSEEIHTREVCLAIIEKSLSAIVEAEEDQPARGKT